MRGLCELFCEYFVSDGPVPFEYGYNFWFWLVVCVVVNAIMCVMIIVVSVMDILSFCLPCLLLFLFACATLRKRNTSNRIVPTTYDHDYINNVNGRS